MKIGIASDHGGFNLKKIIIGHFSEIDFDDVGTHSEESCDYPDYVEKVCLKIQADEIRQGIVICGTGIGASIAANKMKGIRAALCVNEYMAEMSRMHNDANILALGERVIGRDLALKIIERWLATPFEGGRHQRRLDKISSLEN